jgi:Zn-dependent peptidase ImmA (M78 family)/transcriptional regulator with XRE-family HTH domain
LTRNCRSSSIPDGDPIGSDLSTQELGRRLAAAREARHISQDDIARVLGVSRVMVSHWERGERVPAERVLERMAGLYGTTLLGLLGSDRVEPATDLAELLFRDADGTLDATARLGLEDFVRFLDRFADLMGDLGDAFVPLKQSPFSLRTGFTSNDDIRRKAEEARGMLGLGLGPVGDLPTVLDEAGITVYRAALGSDLRRSVSGAFLNHPRMGFAVLVNLETTPGRQLFTMAHELAHAFYHSADATQIVSTWGRRDDRERFADQWASEFLMPSEGLRRTIESLGVKSITEPEQAVQLQRSYGVSYGMVLLRLQQAHLASPEAISRLESAQPLVIASRLGYRVTSEEWRQEPASWGVGRFPRRFIRLVIRAIQEDRMSVASAAGLTNLTIDDISELVSPASEDFDPAVKEELGQFRDVRERIAI